MLLIARNVLLVWCDFTITYSLAIDRSKLKDMFAFAASALMLALAAAPVSATYYLPGVVPHSYDEYESVSFEVPSSSNSFHLTFNVIPFIGAIVCVFLDVCSHGHPVGLLLSSFLQAWQEGTEAREHWRRRQW